MTNKDSINLNRLVGAYGSTFIKDTSANTGKWFKITIITDTVTD